MAQHLTHQITPRRQAPLSFFEISCHVFALQSKALFVHEEKLIHELFTPNYRCACAACDAILLIP